MAPGRKYVGKVVENNDPNQWERVKLECPELYGDTTVENLPWAIPIGCSAVGNTTAAGSFSVPVMGSLLYFTLADDDPNFPEWIGGPSNDATKKELAGENYPHRYGHVDEKGNYFYVDRQTDDVEFYHMSGTKIHITPTGTVNIEIVEDENIIINGNQTIQVDGNVDITVDGNVTAQVGGNVQANVDGSLDATIGSTATVQSAGAMTLQGATVDIIGSTITLNGVVVGTSTATFTGTVIGQGVNLKTHRHTGVQTGSGQSGPPA